MTKIIKGQIYKCAKSYTSKSLGVRAMVFNVTFNNISVISWHGSLMYNYLCNQCPSPLTLWVRISLMTRSIRYNIMWWFVSNLWAGTVYPSGAHEVAPVLSGVRVTRSLVLCVCFVNRFVILSFFFWPLCCVPFRYTDSDNPWHDFALE
jgi:hypothetical protein